MPARCTLGLLLLASAMAWADEVPLTGTGEGPQLEEIAVEAAEPGRVRGSLLWLESVRDELSEDIGSVGRYADALLAGNDVENLPNKSYVRLSAKHTWSEIEARRGSDYAVKLKIDLPRTKRRWKLFFDSENTDASSLSDKTLNTTTQDTSTVGGVRLENNPVRTWQLSADAGIRGRIPLDPFVRLRAGRDWSLAAPWTLSFRHEDWYYYEKGFGTENSLNFHRPLTDNAYLNIVSAVQYRNRVKLVERTSVCPPARPCRNLFDSYNAVELAQSVTTTHRLDDRQSISYSAGVLGVNKPSFKSTAWFLVSRYQRRIHKNWLFLDVTPELLFPRSRDFEPQWSLTLELRALLMDF